MIYVWTAVAVMLSMAAVATMIRMLAGPTSLDRLVALDALVAVTMCAIGAWAAYSRDTTTTYSLTALALITFVGSVSVARFRVPDVSDVMNDSAAGDNPRKGRSR
ncbi:MAG: monovalent cation/H+ antiporter complex subunit F [Actinomycetota bacterium]|nr:monovalent cation/H+ antiporter complex subunit F [Actinomycetota bacterium]